jgi:cyanate permease
MLAVLGFILAAIGIILKLVDKHGDWITWLLLIGLALVCAEVAWGWHRSGYYGRRAA